MANTPITTFRLSAKTKSRLNKLALWNVATMTEIVTNVIDREYDKMSKVTEVFYGVMIGDLFGDGLGETKEIDEDASLDKYMDMIDKKLTEEYPEAEIDSAYQPLGGAIPYSLKTKVTNASGYEDECEIESVDELIGEIWTNWEWVVYK